MREAIDQTGDLNGQQLYRLSKLYPLPDFVKKASANDVYGDDEMQTHQYADPVKRMFPCHTAASTYISALFFMDKKAGLSEDETDTVDSRLDDFAFYHGITKEITKLREKVATDTPHDDLIARHDDDFALVLSAKESSTGKPERHYPLRNALEVKKAAQWLHEHNDELPYSYRQRIADRLLVKAAVYGAGLGDLDDYLQKQAGVGACASLDAAQFLFNRARMLKRAGKVDYAVKMAEMAKTVVSRPAAIHDQDQRVKLAALVDEADRISGLTRLVSDLEPPENVFFAITEKKASAVRDAHVATTSGNIYDINSMRGLKLADVRDVMGEDFANAVSTGGLMLAPEKLAQVVPTMPRGDAELFDNMLRSSGISPVAKEAAVKAGGISNEDLLELSKLHNRKR